MNNLVPYISHVLDIHLSCVHDLLQPRASLDARGELEAPPGSLRIPSSNASSTAYMGS